MNIILLRFFNDISTFRHPCRKVAFQAVATDGHGHKGSLLHWFLVPEGFVCHG